MAHDFSVNPFRLFEPKNGEIVYKYSSPYGDRENTGKP